MIGIYLAGLGTELIAILLKVWPVTKAKAHRISIPVGVILTGGVLFVQQEYFLWTLEGIAWIFFAINLLWMFFSGYIPRSQKLPPPTTSFDDMTWGIILTFFFIGLAGLLCQNFIRLFFTYLPVFW